MGIWNNEKEKNNQQNLRIHIFKQDNLTRTTGTVMKI